MKAIDRVKAAIAPLLEAAENSCPDIFTDFQLNEGFDVQLTMTVKELRDLKQIFDPYLRGKMAAEELKVVSPRKSIADQAREERERLEEMRQSGYIE